MKKEDSPSRLIDGRIKELNEVAFKALIRAAASLNGSSSKKRNELKREYFILGSTDCSRPAYSDRCRVEVF